MRIRKDAPPPSQTRIHLPTPTYAPGGESLPRHWAKIPTLPFAVNRIRLGVLPFNCTFRTISDFCPIWSRRLPPLPLRDVHTGRPQTFHAMGTIDICATLRFKSQILENDVCTVYIMNLVLVWWCCGY